MPPKAQNGAKAPAGTAAVGQLSPDLAELLSQKIREMERIGAEESEKTQKAQKGRARALAKTKIKEAKKLMTDTDTPSTDRVQRLLEMLEAEHEQSQQLASQGEGHLNELGEVERERSASQGELNRTLAVKNKLESLCRQLQQQSDTLVEERKRLTDTERRRRHELADEYQHTIEDVKKKMDNQANERARLARENEELRSSFKKFFEKYDGREKELLEQQKGREVEVVDLNKKLEEQANIYKQEATREAVAQRENQELLNTESVLRGQLQTYSNKFSNFQDALSKSDKVLGQYKRQKSKMQRRVDVLEKENHELKTRNEKRLTTLTRDRDQLLQEKQRLQEKCRALQAERQDLLKEEADG